MKRTVFAMVFCLSVGLAALPLHAQDSDNIQTFEDLVTVRGFMGFNLPSVNIMYEYYNVVKEVIYQPNPSAGGYYGVGIGWNGLGISLVNDVPPGDSDVEKYGESSFENLSMFLYGRQYGIDLYYQRYKGCYLSNPEDFGLHEGDPETIRPDLSLSAVGLNAYYVFSGGFSMVAAFSQTERQLNSGGSVLFMVSAMRLVIDSNAPLIPAAYDGGGYAGFRGGRFYSLAASPGYAYTLVYGGLYLTLGVFIGGGLVYEELDVSSGEKSDYSLMMRSSVKSALGYNGERFFTGIMVVYDIVSGGWWRPLHIEQMLLNMEIFAGTRF